MTPIGTSEAPEIEFWFEFGSNYSPLSVMRIEGAARPHGIRVVWKPFLLSPIFRDLGFETSSFVLQKEKGAYVWQDMARQCRKYGLRWVQPTTFPRLSVLPARIASAGLERAPSAAGSEFLSSSIRCCRHRQQVHTVALLQLPDESMIYPQIFTERSYWPWRDGQGNITPDCVVPLILLGRTRCWVLDF